MWLPASRVLSTPPQVCRCLLSLVCPLRDRAGSVQPVDSRLLSTRPFRYNRIAIKTYLAARQRLLELRASTVRKRNA